MIRRGGFMRRTAFIVFALLAVAVLCAAQVQGRSDSLVVVLKDGHQKAFPMAEVSHIDFKNGSMLLTHAGRQETINMADVVRIDFGSNEPFSAGRNHFVGRWEVGVGVGQGKFFITLKPDGQARKTMGGSHGTWAVVNGEARISWDDGWHDIIRKVGEKHEKLAFEPGKSLDAEPSNVTDARNTTAQPI
jgi:hypothetical protein